MLDGIGQVSSHVYGEDDPRVSGGSVIDIDWAWGTDPPQTSHIMLLAPDIRYI